MHFAMEYEENYINSAKYWLAFHESFDRPLKRIIRRKKDEEAKIFDVWTPIAISYRLRVTKLWLKFL